MGCLLMRLPLPLLILLLSLVLSHAVVAAPVETPKRQLPARKHVPKAIIPDDFSYEFSVSLSGPVNWNKFSKTCENGQHQSPVNFDSQAYNAGEGKRPNITIENSKARRKDFKTVQLSGYEYTLRQFHFHSPSEHHIQGRFFPGEVHFVHASKEGKLSVIGFLLKNADKSDPFFETVLSKRVSPGQLQKPIAVDYRALDRISGELGFNARPTQPNWKEAKKREKKEEDDDEAEEKKALPKGERTRRIREKKGDDEKKKGDDED
ncbi:alpha carbonic anhydrase [Chytridium lagenaria]|nr:alpha carbonic anhydrase [Chytridium lagenaria]